MWTDGETRLQAASVRQEPSRRKLPRFVLYWAAQHSFADTVMMTLPEDFNHRNAHGLVASFGLGVRG